LIAGLLVTAAPADAEANRPTPVSQTQAVAATPKKAHELRNAISDALRREATAQGKSERADAIRELTTLYGEVMQDKLLAYKERLRLAAKMKSRLNRIKKDLQQQIAREKKAKQDGRADDADLLAAQATRDDVASFASMQFAIGSYAAGGPVSLAMQTGSAMGGAGVRDHGEALVELITKTIAPDTWDVNGGHGSIMYFPPLKVLVVRQTRDVHELIGGMGAALRRAGP